MRKNSFLAAAISHGLAAAVEEHNPDANTDVMVEETAAAGQAPVQGVDAVAQAQIEPVVAAAGGEQTSGGKPSGGEESTVEVPEVDSVAELQEKVGALEEEVYEADQGELQTVSEQFKDELAEATDVVASLESLADQIDYAIAHKQCNPSTNAAFFTAMSEAVKRSRMFGDNVNAALEAEGDTPLLPNEAGGEKGAQSIGDKVRGFASTAGKAIVEAIVKFLAWVQDVFAKLTTGAAALQKKFEMFEKNGLDNLTGEDISNKTLIQRLNLVQGSGDAPAQFSNFTRFCSEHLMKVLAGPMTQLINSVAGQKDMSNAPSISDTAIDRMIQLLYPESVENADLEGKSEIGTDWAQGSTGPLLGGLRAWVASNHNLVENAGELKIEQGISRDVATETPESIAGANAQNARADIRAIVSILRNWSTMNLVRRVAGFQSFVMNYAQKQHTSNTSLDMSGGIGNVTTKESTGAVMRQYAQVLRAFCGQNTTSLVRHMLHTFNLYHAYLVASTRKAEAAESAGGAVVPA